MSLAQFLSQIGGTGMGNQTMNAMPGMPGLIRGYDRSQDMAFDNVPLTPSQQLTAMPDMQQQIQTPPDMMQQIERAMPAMQQPSPTSRFTGIRDTLGQIGDYLLQANDMAPIYGPRKAEFEQKQMSETLGQYLGQMDPTIAGIAQQNPQMALKIMEMKAKQSGGQDPTALMQNMEYLRRLNPGMTDAQLAEVAQYAIAAPRMYGSPETGFAPDPNYPFNRAQPEGGDLQDGATATNPQTGEKIVYRNGAWIPMGGASGNAGGGFP
jgi:hypothetical protein